MTVSSRPCDASDVTCSISHYIFVLLNQPCHPLLSNPIPIPISSPPSVLLRTRSSSGSDSNGKPRHLGYRAFSRQQWLPILGIFRKHTVWLRAALPSKATQQLNSATSKRKTRLPALWFQQTEHISPYILVKQYSQTSSPQLP